MGTDARKKVSFENAEYQAYLGHNLPFLYRCGAMTFLPVRIAGVNGVLLVHVVPGGAPLLLSKEYLKNLGCYIDLGRGHLFLEKLGVRAVVTRKQSRICSSLVAEIGIDQNFEPETFHFLHAKIFLHIKLLANGEKSCASDADVRFRPHADGHPEG